VDMRSTGAWAATPGLDRVSSQRVGGLVALPQLIRQLGGVPESVAVDAGLDHSALDHPDGRIPYSALARLLDRSARSTGCDHIGLLAGRLIHLSDLGLVVNSCATLHGRPRARGTDRLSAPEQRRRARVPAEARGLRRSGLRAVPSGGAAVAQVCDAALATAMNILLELCGPAWKPYEVFLPHAKPHDVSQHRAFFKVVPRFDAECSVLRFTARDLERKVPDADPEAHHRCEQLARSVGAPEFMQQVYRGLRRLMLENRHSGDDLARMLFMHRRTLNRRLKAEGTTFQRVLDEVRFDIARDLLRTLTPPRRHRGDTRLRCGHAVHAHVPALVWDDPW